MSNTKKYLVSYLKLNTDPDVHDTGIISFDVIVESEEIKAVTNKEAVDLSNEPAVVYGMSLINGLDNKSVLKEHRVLELDDPENIAVRHCMEQHDGVLAGLVNEDAPVGLVSYYYRPSVHEPKQVFLITSPYEQITQ